MSTSARGGRNRHNAFPIGTNRTAGGGGNTGGGGHNNNNNNSNNSNNAGGGGNNMNKSKWHSQGPSSPVDRSMQNKDKDTYMMHQHDRALFLLMHLVGTRVKVTVKGGTQYEGLFHAAATESELGVVLKMARQLPGSKTKSNGTASDEADTDANSNSPVHTLVILSKDLLQMDAVNVDFTVPQASAVPLPVKTPKSPASDGFKTDTAISGKKGEVRERTLRKWADYSDDEELPELGYPFSYWGTSEDAPATQPWDQFEANKKLFGLKSDYNEEIYTTKLDRNKPDYKEREKVAIKIANEIMRTTTDNAHLAEERGQIAPDDNMDEEDRYGAVLRAAKGPVPGALGGGKGKYQPPQSRAKMLLQQQQQQSTTQTSGTSATSSTPLVVKATATSTTTQSITQTTSSLPKQTHPLSCASSSAAASASNRKLTSSYLAKLKNDLLKGMPKIEESLKKVESEKKPSTTTAEDASASKSPPLDSLPPKMRPLAPAPSAQSGLPIRNKDEQTGATIPKIPLDLLRPGMMARSTSSTDALGGVTLSSVAADGDKSQKALLRTAFLARLDKKIHAERSNKKPIEAQVVGTFRKFVSTEKERLQQKKQALIRKEKDSRIAELVKFGQSFKLKLPMPEDLVDIVTNDPKKKQQILEEKVHAEKSISTSTTTTSTTSTTTVSTTTATTAETTKPTVSATSSTSEPATSKTEDTKTAVSPPDTKQSSESTETTSASTTTVTKKEDTEVEEKTSSTTATAESKDKSAVVKTEEKKPVLSASKLNANASEFRPNPAAAPFVPGGSAKKTFGHTSTDTASVFNPFFGDKTLKKGKLSVRSLFKELPDELESPDEIGSTWSLGDKPFQQQFQMAHMMEEAEMYGLHGFPGMMPGMAHLHHPHQATPPTHPHHPSPQPPLPPPVPHQAGMMMPPPHPQFGYAYPMSPYHRYPHPGPPQHQPGMMMAPPPPGSLPYMTPGYVPQDHSRHQAHII
ncbi:hypothetical protein BDF19DRAFT_424979 [Syncephalis fuscata]|nr:hypothetical protein BDF19DRAFT_424979 [Syncephalis fuscata]